MRVFIPVLVVGLSLVALVQADAGNDAAVKKELETIAGKWNMLKVETGGGQNESVEGSSVRFDSDGTIEYSRADKVLKGTFTIDPTKQPKQITITPDGSEKSVPGIYKIDNNRMTVCQARKNSERPKEFALTKDEQFVLFTLERAK